MICPKCRAVATDGNYFCLNDGTPLVEENDKQTTVSNWQTPFNAGQGAAAAPAPSPRAAQTPIYPPQPQGNYARNPTPPNAGYAQQGGSATPQFQQPITQSPSSASTMVRNVIIGLLAVIALLLAFSTVFLIVTMPRQTEDNKVANPAAPNTVPSKIENTAVNTVVTSSSEPDTNSEDKPATKKSDLPTNFDRVYTGYSKTRGGDLPLTLTLKRNGNRLYGSAETPGDLDELEGSVSDDGTFTLRGYNRNVGRETGTWRGRITKNAVSGVWTPDKGANVSFSGSLIR